jgi:O-antigen/teichoic acid export membrane protein
MLCIGGFFCSLQYFNYQAVAAIGKSKVLFYAGIVKSCFLIVSIMISVRISMEAVLVAMILSNIVNYLVNAIIAQIYIKYSVWQQIVDVLQILVLSIIVGGITYCLYDKLNVNWVLTIAMFLAMYVAANYLVKNEMITNIIKLIIKIKDR